MKATWPHAQIQDLMILLADEIDNQNKYLEERRAAVKAEQANYDSKPWWKRWQYDNPRKQWFGTHNMWLRDCATDGLESMCKLYRRLEWALQNNAESITLSPQDITYIKKAN